MKKKYIIIAIIIATVAVLIIAVCFFVFSGKRTDENVLLKGPVIKESSDLPVLIDKELELMEEEGLEPGSFSKIDEAFDDGEITLDEMYSYKLIAMFGAEQLPEKFSSVNVDSLRGDRIIMMIQEDWEKLESETQEILEPFILPFSDEKSFFYHSNYELREGIISNLAQQ